MTANATQGNEDVIFHVKGLSGSGEILIDKWGVPHIYAPSIYDAFRLQGFNAARERLWQIDLWRRRGLGLLSEVFGPEYKARDRAARLFLYRGSMHDEWLAYGSDTKQAATAFAEGVNAWVAKTREEPSLLSPEFGDVGYVPSFWQPEDLARMRSHGLFYNVRHEAARASTMKKYGPEVEKLRQPREPQTALNIPEGLELEDIPDDVLEVYELATTQPSFPPESINISPTDHPPEGSNNWVLAGSRTASGRPLLANDPHRAVGLPGLRYIAHLSAPGFDVIGAGEPGLPGVSIGHNGHIAFGLTIFPIDQEDLYVYETNPDNQDEYKYQDRWEPFETVTEEMSVAGRGTETVYMRYTRHGPVIYEDPERGRAYAVRAAWLQPGMAPYLGSMDFMRAKNWDEFLAAMNRWGAPPENQVYADPAGNIGWKTGGLTPVRPNWNGTFPVPGDGRYEWQDFYDMDQLPSSFNDACGFIATANEMNLPSDFPADRTITHDWYSPHRKQRIDEVLGSRADFTVDDMVKLQMDTVSIPAQRIVAVLNRLLPAGKSDRARALLADWNGDLKAESAAAALFEVWFRRHLRRALRGAALENLVDHQTRDEALAAIWPAEVLLADARIDLELLENPGNRLGPDPEETLVRILETSLASAFVDCCELLGNDVDHWQWGQLHVASPAHPLKAHLKSVAKDRKQLPPLPRGGSGETVMNTAYLPSFVQSAGATFSIVVDVGAWDNSVAMNSPGQSGDPRSPHYDDLYAPWANGESFPLLYSRSAVLGAAETRIVVQPENEKTATSN